VTSAGRPRRFEPADELRLLFDGALVVMERNGYADATVAGILAEAGLSTRSFYRHFDSKDHLLCALYRREAEAAAERLAARVSAAATPLAALDTWIEEVMSLGYDERKAARVAVLASPGAMRAEGYADETAHAIKLQTAPLQELLAAGLRDGSRWPIPPPTRSSSSRSYGTRPGSARRACPPSPRPRRSDPPGRSAGARSGSLARRGNSTPKPVVGTLRG
jgi:AcrR family transcriptional regulator